MHAAVKILIGLLVIVVGFGLFMDSPSMNLWDSVTRINWWNNFVIVLTGVIPPLLILLGLFIVWLEADELKAEKEIEEETPAETSEVKAAVTPPKPAAKAASKRGVRARKKK